MRTPAYIAALVGGLILVLSPVTASAGPGVVPGPTSGPATGSATGPPTGPTAGHGTVDAGWSWPLSPRPAVLRAFDPPARPWLSGHRGVDLRASRRGP